MATEPMWYVNAMRDQANRECMEGEYDDVPCMNYDDAIGFCVTCGSPIWSGDSYDATISYESVSEDRHGIPQPVTIPAFMWHRNADQCGAIG